MEAIVLTAEKREPGRHSAKHTRQNGRVPGVFYGHGRETALISVDAKTLVKFLATEHTLVQLELNGEKAKSVVRDYDTDPVTGRITHVDIMSVRADRPIDVWVPIVFVGLPTGVKNKGGILQHDMNEFHIKCLPDDIPGHLEVNVEELDVAHSIHVRDLQFDKIQILNPLSESVCTVVIPKAVEAATAEVAPTDAAAVPVEPELVGGKGKEEPKEEEK